MGTARVFTIFRDLNHIWKHGGCPHVNPANSPNNKYNPDPTNEVRWGDQTYEEMMIGWFHFTVPSAPYLVSQDKVSLSADVADERR